MKNLAIVFVLGLLFSQPAFSGEFYAAGQVGGTLWACTSNDCELEADSDMMPAYGGALGYRFNLLEPIHLRTELEISTQANDIHGVNGQSCESDDCSADHLSDNVIRATSGMVNVWPGVEIIPDLLSAYAGGGLGVTYLTALGDEQVTGAVQGGAGVEINLTKRIILDAGYRGFQAFPVELDGQDTDYVTHGPMLRLSVSF